ncbi:hypothetical protein CPB84DRAFT_1763750, partial [Gymnopilus junonius]
YVGLRYGISSKAATCSMELIPNIMPIASELTWRRLLPFWVLRPRASGARHAKANSRPVFQCIPLSLEQLETNLDGEDKKLFLQFIRKMLQWDPQDRMTPKELLKGAG